MPKHRNTISSFHIHFTMNIFLENQGPIWNGMRFYQQRNFLEFSNYYAYIL